MGIYKINVDGATMERANAVGVGIIIRDWQGRFVVAKLESFEGSLDALRVEAMGYQRGARFCTGTGSKIGGFGRRCQNGFEKL